MIRLSENGTVRLAGLKPEMDVALQEVEKVYNEFDRDTVITAGTEEFAPNGKLYHSVGSYHPRGYAIDFRRKHIPGKLQTKVFKLIKTALRTKHTAYDVVLESDHIHVEFDLKKAFKGVK